MQRCNDKDILTANADQRAYLVLAAAKAPHLYLGQRVSGGLSNSLA
jgi:hypothetical protein